MGLALAIPVRTEPRRDIPVLHAILAALPQALPVTAEELDVRGLLGGKVRKWRCERGHDNPLSEERCETCRIDKHGLPLGGYGLAAGEQAANTTLAALEEQFQL
jgi:hypothetical protein